MKKSTLVTSLIILAATNTFTFWLTRPSHKSNQTLQTQSASSVIQQPKEELPLELKIVRLQGYEYTRPLAFVEKEEEANNLLELKKKVSQQIDEYKKDGSLQEASVYLRVFGKGDWMSIDNNKKYNPGSLIKIPILITYLKMAELHPGLLNKTLQLPLDKIIPHQTFNSNQIVAGKAYTIKELLSYMVSYSDNNATYLLNENVNLELFKKLFNDLQLTVPNVSDRNYQISAHDYSVFLITLFNAGYLTIDDSEFAFSLMAKCDFKEGMVKQLPPSLQVTHKFGEWGNKQGNHQLHESGIVYLNKTPYLLTIMTEGNDVKKLPQIISQISKSIYDDIKMSEVTF